MEITRKIAKRITLRDDATENVYDFEEDGDQMRREYFAYNEGSYYDEHYRVELRPKYVN